MADPYASFSSTVAPPKKSDPYAAFSSAAPEAPPAAPARAPLPDGYRDPKTGRLRVNISPARPTREQLVAETARRAVDENEKANPGAGRQYARSILGGANNSLFGLPGRLYAAATGTPNDLVQGYLDESGSRAPITNFLSTLAPSLITGSAIAGGVKALGARAVASGAPIVARAGNVLQKLTTFEKAKGFAPVTRLANTGRAAFAGGAAGATDAAVKGRDIVTGATVGAVAAPVLGTGFKAVNKLLLQPASTALRLSSTKAILRKYVGTTAEEVQGALRNFRARAGSHSEPTLYEVLDTLKDRESVQTAISRAPASARDRAARLVRERGASIGGELREQITNVAAPAREGVVRGITDALTRARGGAPGPDDAALVQRAANAATAFPALRRAEAQAIMAPHENTPVVDNLNDLYPAIPGPNGARMEADPEVSAAIRGASESLGRRRAGEGITAGEITNIISNLGDDQGRGLITGGTATRAIEHLRQTIGERAPEAAEAAQRMTDAFAARSRMGEGVDEGMLSRTRTPIRGATNNRLARTLDNAYDTPEGQAGRTLGQSNILLNDLNTGPQSALGLAEEIANNPNMQQAIEANLGGRGGQGAQIADAAQAQTESARRLAGLDREQQATGNLDLPHLARAIIHLRPGSLPTSKAGAISAISGAFQGLPEAQANKIVDALFSRNPGQIVQTLKLLNNSGDAGKVALRQLSQSLIVGAGAADIANEQPGAVDPSLDPAPAGVVPAAEAAPAPEPEPEAAPQPGDDPNVPYGRAVIASLFPQAEITSDVRSPDDPLSIKNPGSDHVKTQNAVDVRPIPGLTFAQYIGQINDAGYTVIEARDEAAHPIPGLTTGPHWHVVVA